MTGERDLDRLLATLEPERRSGTFVYVTLPEPADLPAQATIHEAEGVTHVLQQRDADAAGLAYDVVLGWITIQVHSSLEAVGLTATLSSALAEAGISCNVLAGTFHDHLLVPVDRTDEALTVLRGLSGR